MSIDGSDAHRIYQPDFESDRAGGILAAFDAGAQATLDADARDWSGAAHLPDTWVVALAGLDPDTPCGIDISGIWVVYTVTGRTFDPAAMCIALQDLRRVVSDTPVSRLGTHAVDRRLPAQIGSAHWRTEGGEATVNNPDRPRRHRKPRRFPAAGAVIPALWALAHGKLGAALYPAASAVAVASVAAVTFVATPAVAPLHPRPGITRDVHTPDGHLAGAPSSRTSAPRKTRMDAPAPSPTAAPSPTPATTPAEPQPSQTPSAGSPSTTKPMPAKKKHTRKPATTTVPPLLNLKRHRRRRCPALLQLLHKPCQAR